ncbi:MAG: hypothetical protein CME70_05085 [Halobacteriovorax sp.]|nr:hypothetical protein [Halobacteriovorax sp.]|tara:strand:+ start:37952 stop:38401 length:450 start_codon:yes stop_codon:yes gene_type:complete
MEFNFIKIFGGGKTLIDVGLFIPDSVEKILLALSDGEQSKESIHKSFEPWLQAAKEDNCLILAPCAPDGVLFHEGGELLVPRMIEVFFQSMEQKPRKMAIAGIGEGAKSAEKIHTLFPDLFTKISIHKDYSELTNESIKKSWDYLEAIG